MSMYFFPTLKLNPFIKDSVSYSSHNLQWLLFWNIYGSNKGLLQIFFLAAFISLKK